MNRLNHQRCFNHAQRVAAARCPECSRFYCRECITEHEGRVLCAECIGKQLGGDASKGGFLNTVTCLIFILIGILTAWFFYYNIGQTLLSLPDEFHDGTIWQTGRTRK